MSTLPASPPGARTSYPQSLTSSDSIKSTALHLEHKTSISAQATPLDQPDMVLRIVDTPSRPTPISEHSQAPSYHTRPPSLQSATVAGASQHSHDNSRPPTSSSSDTTARPPTPIENFPPEPKLWVHDGPLAGFEHCEWRHTFAPIIYETYKHLSISARTRTFDRLVRKNKDRYLTACAAYYGHYPEHLPQEDVRPPTAERVRSISRQLREHEDGTWEATQLRLFGGWEWDFEKPVVEVPESLGPRDEKPGEDLPLECRHCVKKAKMKRVKSALRPVWAPIRIARKKLSMGSKNAQQQQQQSLGTKSEGKDDRIDSKDGCC